MKNKSINIFLLLSLILMCLTGCTESGKIDTEKAEDIINQIEKVENVVDNVNNVMNDLERGDISDALNTVNNTIKDVQENSDSSIIDTISNISESVSSYSGQSYKVLNNNNPEFSESDYTINSFESYSDLDSLGRCGVAFACVGQDLMPTEDRGSISSVKPSGWQSTKYDIISGKYLYNRCHLIGFQLTGENANKENLITGTRYLNIDGMLPFENMVADYVKETNNHVLYRVTPIYEGNNLVASGVQMEAWSVEDDGEGICFNVYCYNVQPGVVINYATGESQLKENYDPDLFNESLDEELELSDNNDDLDFDYVLNSKSKKIHKVSCSEVKRISAENKENYSGDLDILKNQGYTPCGKCNP